MKAQLKWSHSWCSCLVHSHSVSLHRGLNSIYVLPSTSAELLLESMRITDLYLAHWRHRMRFYFVLFFFSFYCRRTGFIFGWYLWYDTNSVKEFTQSNKFTFGTDFKCHLVEYLPVLFYTWENWVLKTLNYLIKYSFW